MSSSPITLNEHNTADFYADLEAHDRGLTKRRKDSWSTDSSIAEIPHAPIRSLKDGNGGETLLLDVEGCLVLVEKQTRSVTVTAHAREDTAALARVDEVREWLPVAARIANQLEVSFWYYTNNGPRCYERRLQAPAWADISSNYPSGTRAQLEKLQAIVPDDKKGKLILWQGEPGTGKTFALRSLAEEWGDWCKVHCVLDPERFFMEGDYLLSVILGNDESPSVQGAAEVKPSWRLVVLEDTGELLSKDAKDRSGQGLSRLLNLCDGLLGQGLRVMVLITTNEEVGTLHKAVIRPGRCLAHVEFQRFEQGPACAWLERNGLVNALGEQAAAAVSAGRKPTLAELYAILAGEAIEGPRSVGFGR